MRAQSTSADVHAIERAVARLRASEEFAKNVFDPEWSAFERDFDVVARYANGETRLRFKALRILRRHFTRRQVFMLSMIGSDSAFQHWRLLIRERAPGEKPDGGKRDRQQKRDWRAARLGMLVYAARKRGVSKAEAIEMVRSELGLNLADSTIEKDLARFRRLAQENGYVDPYAPVMVAMLGRTMEPELTTRDVLKRGRPSRPPAAKASEKQ